MVDLGTVGILAQAGTGFLVLLAGLVALISASPRRHTVSFALFLVLWGGYLLAGNFAGLALETGSYAQSEELLILHAVLQGVAYLPLLVFTLSYPPSRQADLDRWPVVGALLAPALAVMATIAVDPALFHPGFTLEDGILQGSWGPAKAGVFLVFRVAIYAVLARLVLVRERSTNELERRQALYVLLGFSLYIGYESIQDLLLFSDEAAAALAGSGPVEPLVFAATSLVGIGLLLWVSGRLLVGARPLTGPARKLTVGCVAGSLALGMVAGASSTWQAIPDLSGASVWRLGAVALIMSAVFRFELSEPGKVLPAWGSVLGWLGVAAAALLTMQLGLSTLLGSSLLALIVLWGLLVASAGLVAWRRPGTFAELVRQVRRKRSSVGQARRDLELYEAALLSGHDEQDLDELRSRMSISSAEHSILERMTDPHSSSPMPRERPFSVGDVVDGRYHLQGLLGEGASSRVYRAEDRVEGEAVALKLLDPEQAASPRQLRQFLYESRVCLRLNHPHIVEAYDLGHAEGLPYLASELVEAGTLASQLDEEGLDAREACSIVEGILAGLQHLHEEGLVHRDLKPSNVLVDDRGRAKLGDLGLADTWDAERTQELGPEGGRLREGTPAYMGPEALLGHPPSPRCDVYAAGAILVEALRGSHYLDLEGAPYGTMKRAVIETEPRLDGIDPELAAVCSRALDKDPSRRYDSAEAMREAILDVVAPERSTGYEAILSEVVQPEPPERSRRSAREGAINERA